MYFDSRGIANVLSLYPLGKQIRVTYDSNDCDGVFQVHTTKGIVEFKPTPKGLHALNLKENPEATFLLVNDVELVLPNPDSIPDHHAHVNTVRDNYEGFSCNQIERARIAQRLMGMVATPSACDFQGLVCLSLLKDCPVTNDDIKKCSCYIWPQPCLHQGKDGLVQTNQG